MQYFKMALKIKMADFVLMHRLIRGDSLYAYEQFGADRKLYVKVLMLDGKGEKWFPPSHPLEYDVAVRFP